MAVHLAHISLDEYDDSEHAGHVYVDELDDNRYVDVGDEDDDNEEFEYGEFDELDDDDELDDELDKDELDDDGDELLGNSTACCSSLSLSESPSCAPSTLFLCSLRAARLFCCRCSPLSSHFRRRFLVANNVCVVRTVDSPMRSG
jgi:hypothetical protein